MLKVIEKMLTSIEETLIYAACSEARQAAPVLYTPEPPLLTLTRRVSSSGQVYEEWLVSIDRKLPYKEIPTGVSNWSVKAKDIEALYQGIVFPILMQR